MTRGALYHQFTDKTDLFAAVLDQVEAEIAQRVADAVAGFDPADTTGMLLAGAGAWLDASSEPELQRIVLLDGPSVLGWDRWREICLRHTVGLIAALLQDGIDRGSPAAPARPGPDPRPRRRRGRGRPLHRPSRRPGRGPSRHGRGAAPPHPGAGRHGVKVGPKWGRPSDSVARQQARRCGSRWTVTWSTVRRAEAGHAVETGPVNAARTGSALRASGTMARTWRGPEQGGDGHGERVGRARLESGKWPSLTCCCRQAGSSSTTLTSSGSSKSATGGR